MKLRAKTVEVDNTFDAEEFGMETTDPAVIQILLESVYPDPYVWPRELLANWHDAGGGGELILPDTLDPNWVIEDHGEGMSHWFMTNRYTKIFDSSKRDSDSAIGGFGHGRLSPLAYTDTFNVRSRYRDEDGTIMEGNYVVFKGENKIPNIVPVSFGPSEVQQTGVRVTIPIGDADVKRISERTRFFASYLPNPPSGFEKVSYDFKNETGGLRSKNQNEEMAGVRIIVGGVPYPLPPAIMTDYRNIPFDIFFQINELSPTLSREAINADAAALTLITDRLNKLVDEYRETVTEEVKSEPSLLDSYTKYLNILSRFPYGYKNRLFPAHFGEQFSKLPGGPLFAAASGDFNIHQITSDIDRYGWDDLDIDTRTFRSLKGLRIRDLTGTGRIQRRGKQEFDNGGLDFSDFIKRRNSNNETQPNVALFAIKYPYVQGHIKLIKEAVTAKLSELRTPDSNGHAKIGNNATAILIQYEEESDVAKIAKVISPNLPVTMITDTSKRSAGNQYVNVVTADKKTASRTKPIKLKQLSDLGKIVVIERDPSWKVFHIHDILNNLRSLPVFADKTLVAMQKADLILLPQGYVTAEEEIHKFLKKFGYSLDGRLIAEKISESQRITGQLKGGLLRLYVKDKTLLSIVQEKLPNDKELTDYINAIESGSSATHYETIIEIRDVINTISNLKNLGFFKKKQPEGGNRPLPEVQPDGVKAVEAFNNKYPLLKALSDQYTYSRAISPAIAAGLIEYMELKNRNCQ